MALDSSNKSFVTLDPSVNDKERFRKKGQKQVINTQKKLYLIHNYYK